MITPSLLHTCTRTHTPTHTCSLILTLTPCHHATQLQQEASPSRNAGGQQGGGSGREARQGGTCSGSSTGGAREAGAAHRHTKPPLTPVQKVLASVSPSAVRACSGEEGGVSHYENVSHGQAGAVGGAWGRSSIGGREGGLDGRALISGREGGQGGSPGTTAFAGSYSTSPGAAAAAAAAGMYGTSPPAHMYGTSPHAYGSSPPLSRSFGTLVRVLCVACRVSLCVCVCCVLHAVSVGVCCMSCECLWVCVVGEVCVCVCACLWVCVGFSV